MVERSEKARGFKESKEGKGIVMKRVGRIKVVRGATMVRMMKRLKKFREMLG